VLTDHAIILQCSTYCYDNNYSIFLRFFFLCSWLDIGVLLVLVLRMKLVNVPRDSYVKR
jgi:hypothetical protein